MQYKIIYFYLLTIFVTISSCTGKKKEVNEHGIKKENSTSLPCGAIPIYYNSDSIKLIYFDAIFNDTDNVVIIWDTGANRVTMPNLFINSLNEANRLKLKIGSNELTYKEEIYFSDVFNQGIIARKRRKNILFTGWNLFKDKIVEVSYANRYIRILKNSNNLESYECIPFSIKNNKLFTNISVSIQNKTFHIKDALIDTGFNESFISDNRQLSGIDMKKSRQVPGLASPDKNPFKGNFLLADRISIGNMHVDSIMICVTEMGALKFGNWTFTNILGNTFFENFSVIFDFRNHNLYLKPLNNWFELYGSHPFYRFAEDKE
jgi:hypothetical protein